MQVLIINDGGATKIAREVASMAEVEDIRARGFRVEVVGVDDAPEVPAELLADADVTKTAPAKKAAKKAA